MKNRMLTVFAMMAMVIVMAGCAKVPQVEIDAAKAAVEEARSVGADLYQQAQFAAVQDSLKVALANVETQKSKLFSRYGAVKIQLEGVKTLSMQVKESTLARIEEVKQEINTTMTEVSALVVENQELLTKAPKGKEGREALEQIKTDMAGIDASVVDAQNMLNSGDLLGTLDKIKAAKEKSMGINAELKAAIEKSKGGRK
jgi:cell fate (sporulation/competence/biofilm development) regulator YlbF (YheA/YmcA/DUF963 family)